MFQSGNLCGVCMVCHFLPQTIPGRCMVIGDPLSEHHCSLLSSVSTVWQMAKQEIINEEIERFIFRGCLNFLDLPIFLFLTLRQEIPQVSPDAFQSPETKKKEKI